jgi:hypothetical protein
MTAGGEKRCRRHPIEQKSWVDDTIFLTKFLRDYMGRGKQVILQLTELNWCGYSENILELISQAL